MKKVIERVNAVLSDKILYNVNVLIEDGIIKKISSEQVGGDKTINGEGLYLIPGFIDMHCHGGLELDFIDCSASEMKEIEKFHLSHGTTTMLATTLTADEEQTEKCLRNFESYLKSNPLSTFIGLHMEGPWFSPEECGAQDPSAMQKPDPEHLKNLKKSFPFIKRVSVAPELDGGLEIGNVGNELGILMSIGHTSADFDQTVCAFNNGYKLLTHFYSGMRGVIRRNSYRIAGAVEAGYYLDGMDVEIIADGRHLPESLLKLIYKIKGADRISLITDATRGCGLANGTKSFIGPKASAMPIIIENDVAFTADRQSFAGSTATFDRLYKTMAKAIGSDWVSLSKMASLNPARLLGLTDRGEIKEGKRADLILMNENFDIESVILNGEERK